MGQRGKKKNRHDSVCGVQPKDKVRAHGTHSKRIRRYDVLLINNQRGTVLLEFVVASLLLSLILAGIVNLGVAYRSKVAVIAAAREAARTAVVLHDSGDSLEDARRKARLRGEEMLEFAFDVFEDPVVKVEQSGGFITATATTNVPLIFPGFGYLLGSDHPRTVDLKGTASYMLGEGRV